MTPSAGDLIVGVAGLGLFVFCMFGGHIWLQDLWFKIRDAVRGRASGEK